VAYEVRLQPSADREFRGLPRAAQARVVARLVGLASDHRPHGVKKLGGEGGFLRIRVGDYRVIYAIDDPGRIVWVVKVGHRGDVYRGR